MLLVTFTLLQVSYAWDFRQQCTVVNKEHNKMKVSVNFISACYVLVWRCLWIAIIISVFVSYIHIIQKGTRYEWNTTARESNIIGSLSRLERKQYKFAENGKSISDLYSMYLTGKNLWRNFCRTYVCGIHFCVLPQYAKINSINFKKVYMDLPK